MCPPFWWGRPADPRPTLLWAIFCPNSSEERRRGRRAQRANGVTASDVGSVHRRTTSVSGGKQIANGDGLVAVRAGTTRTEPTGEGVAVGAALVAEVASVAGRAGVDGGWARRA